MGFVDKGARSNRLGAGAAVMLIEAGLAWGVIAGLAYTVVPHRDPHIRTTDFPLPKPSEKPKERAQHEPETRPTAQPSEHPFDMPSEGTTVLPPTGGTERTGDDDIGTVLFPREPQPPQVPPLRAKPKGNPGLWVTPNDYPTDDLRREHTGTTRFRLTIEPDGRVGDCAITVSSGWPGLDAATCAKLASRARFEPATDSTGARTRGSYSGAVSWRMPE